jgi:hypothetical protein
MPTAPPPQPPARHPHGLVELTLTIELDPDSPNALLRTLVLLHRRRCRVTEAEYRSRIDGSDYLDLRVQAPPAHAHCLPAWLSTLLEVRCVTEQRQAAPNF